MKACPTASWLPWSAINHQQPRHRSPPSQQPRQSLHQPAPNKTPRLTRRRPFMWFHLQRSTPMPLTLTTTDIHTQRSQSASRLGLDVVTATMAAVTEGATTTADLTVAGIRTAAA